MALSPRIWYPVAVLGTLANLVGVAFAVSPGEPLHATIHAGLAVAFGVWAQRLKARLRPGIVNQDKDADIEALRDEIDAMGREVGELQERLDFVERVLSQASERERLPSDDR
jgi:hypothetical protein